MVDEGGGGGWGRGSSSGGAGEGGPFVIEQEVCRSEHFATVWGWVGWNS